jgi:hypothetical protein
LFADQHVPQRPEWLAQAPRAEMPRPAVTLMLEHAGQPQGAPWIAHVLSP